MKIKKIYIENFKSFRKLELNLKSGINILVGNNEAGKSTILEAIHLALTGLLNGKYLRNDFTEYLFNTECIDEYMKAPESLPYILIEIFFEDGIYPKFEGTLNHEKKDKQSGISFKIVFDEKYQNEYNEMLKNKNNIRTLPIEYYEIVWSSFSRDRITSKSIPIKSALIDSSSNRFQNGSDTYLSRIIKENLDESDLVQISQAHRKIKDGFMEDESIKIINSKVKGYSKLTTKDLSISVELTSKNAWESTLMTYFDKIPFHFIGKGEQCVIKTDLALSHKKTAESSLLLVEELENHLTYAKLNSLINRLKTSLDKQIIISTHSSFVANKLGLDHLIFLHDKKIFRLDELSKDSKKFFEKIAGYDTLRLILCKKAILVEGDSDELIIQKAYMIENNGKLPIEDEMDVISVGTSFKRFLEIAEKIDKEVVVVTDNDGNLDAINKKYKDYLGDNKNPNIKICYDREINPEITIDNKPYNNNTLEPNLLKTNSLENLNTIFGTSYKTDSELKKYMKSNKTECALKIFDTTESINFPKYILEAIR